MNTAFSEVADAVGKELNSKYNLIREAASNGYRPYGIFLEEMIEELSKRFPSADFTMLRYCTQEYSLRPKSKLDLRSLCKYSCEIIKMFILNLRSYMQKNHSHILMYFRNLIKSNTVQWQAFPGKDKYDLYVEFTKELMTVSACVYVIHFHTI